MEAKGEIKLLVLHLVNFTTKTKKLVGLLYLINFKITLALLYCLFVFNFFRNSFLIQLVLQTTSMTLFCVWAPHRLSWRWEEYISSKQWHLPTSLQGAKPRSSSSSLSSSSSSRLWKSQVSHFNTFADHTLDVCSQSVQWDVVKRMMNCKRMERSWPILLSTPCSYHIVSWHCLLASISE
jgi:hypothetical protein